MYQLVTRCDKRRQHPLPVLPYFGELNTVSVVQHVLLLQDALEQLMDSTLMLKTHCYEMIKSLVICTSTISAVT